MFHSFSASTHHKWEEKVLTNHQSHQIGCHLPHWFIPLRVHLWRMPQPTHTLPTAERERKQVQYIIAFHQLSCFISTETSPNNRITKPRFPAQPHLSIDTPKVEVGKVTSMLYLGRMAHIAISPYPNTQRTSKTSHKIFGDNKKGGNCIFVDRHLKLENYIRHTR